MIKIVKRFPNKIVIDKNDIIKMTSGEITTENSNFDIELLKKEADTLFNLILQKEKVNMKFVSKIWLDIDNEISKYLMYYYSNNNRKRNAYKKQLHSN